MKLRSGGSLCQAPAAVAGRRGGGAGAGQLGRSQDEAGVRFEGRAYFLLGRWVRLMPVRCRT